MNPVFENINNRRSVRRFDKEKLISSNDVELILRAAMQAPSAKNQQMWEYIVIDDRQTLDEIALKHPYGKMLQEAPLAILVLGNLNKVKSALYPQDLGATTQNILLACTALGLGSCWLGVNQNDERASLLKEYFSLPDHIIPFSMVAIGYPLMSDALKYIDRYRPELVRYNRW